VVREIFRRVQSDRDIVLVDQRGTGKSNPLDCNDDDDSLQAFMETNEQMLDRLKACQAKYDADLTLYTTPIAMDDLDDVRRFLGYDKINVYGGSYGTRAALVYMRQHGDRVEVGDPRRRRAAQHAAAALLSARHAARLRAAREGLRERRGLQQGLSEPARAHARADRSPRQEPADRQGHASATGATADIKIDARLLANVIVPLSIPRS
jgi:pimeloyl-ACP methyl ester carboxylesterase